MRDRKSLQAGTSHYLGQNFARAYGVQFQTRTGGLEYAYATSWGVSARLVPPGDAAALVAALGGVLDDPAGAARMAAAARDLVTARWSWAVSAKATLELYRTVVRERAGDRTG